MTESLLNGGKSIGTIKAKLMYPNCAKARGVSSKS